MTKVNTSAPSSSTTTKPRASEFFQKTYESLSARYRAGNRSLSFPHIVASPIHYEPGYAYPLLVWLHDAEKTETEIFDVTPKISTRNYVSVAPRGLTRDRKRVVRTSVNGRLTDEKCWYEPCNDWPETAEGVSEAENLVFDSIAEARAKFNINTRRIFLLGHGTGGTMALRVAMRNPHDFAGVASIDGALPSTDSIPLRNWRSMRELPVLVTIGDPESTTVPRLNADLLRLYHTAGLTVLVRQYNESRNAKGGTSRMTSVLADVNRWIMERTTNPQVPPSEMYSQYAPK